MTQAAFKELRIHTEKVNKKNKSMYNHRLVKYPEGQEEGWVCDGADFVCTGGGSGEWNQAMLAGAGRWSGWVSPRQG